MNGLDEEVPFEAGSIVFDTKQLRYSIYCTNAIILQAYMSLGINE